MVGLQQDRFQVKPVGAGGPGWSRAFVLGKPYLKKITPRKDSYTPPKFNMEPENDSFQKESPFPGVDFPLPC